MFEKIKPQLPIQGQEGACWAHLVTWALFLLMQKKHTHKQKLEAENQ